MDLSRRDWNAFWALLLATNRVKADTTPLPSKCFSFESLPVRVDNKTGASYRQVFKGMTHEGVPIDLHITTMPPGQSPHPPHHHEHEEMMLVQEGKLEATISGHSTVVGPGSVIYVRSNDHHGLKNTGDIPAQYFVLAIGQQTEA